MENVSHNTSFDSNEDDLSRATNEQQFFEELSRGGQRHEQDPYEPG